MTAQLHPIRIEGNWNIGYALDVHTVSSQYLGDDEFGRAMFETERSDMGELVYRLKYQNDLTALPAIVKLVVDFATFKTIDVIVPVPPSNEHRSIQPVIEVAQALGKELGIRVCADAVQKIKETPELKTVEDFQERLKILSGAFRITQNATFAGRTVMLFDDLYRSGATLSAIASVLNSQGKAKSVKVLTLTKTRSKK